MNRIMKAILAMYVGANQKDWDSWLPLVQFAINNSWQESICATPFMLNTGAHPTTPNSLQSKCIVPAAGDFAQHVSDIVAQARDAMAAAQQRQKKAADKNRRHVTFSVVYGHAADTLVHVSSCLSGLVPFGLLNSGSM
jgi:hypothetical protein